MAPASAAFNHRNLAETGKSDRRSSLEREGGLVRGQCGALGSVEKLDVSRGRKSLVRLGAYDKILLLIFVLTLPLSNPWVRGDGVGYYAFGQSLLIEHNLDFRNDWLAANTSFRMGRTDASGNVLPDQFTSTGHLDNHFSVGPAILWAPFLITAHLAVLVVRRARRPHRRRRIFGAVPRGYGDRYCPLRISRHLDFVPARSKISSRTMGLSCRAGHLVRKLSSRVHVFQSILVPRSFRVHGCTLPLLLGSHAC